MILEPQSTPWDLRWTMFGIPVRVHPMFWLVALLMGQGALDDGFLYLLAWIGCVFVSILVHELGHVVMGMIYGSHGQIVLYAFGGLAIGSNHLNNRWQRIAVSLAGPGAGFLFLIAILGVLWARNAEDGAVYLSITAWSVNIPVPRNIDLLLHEAAMRQTRSFEYEVVRYLIFTNLFWGLLNLLPVWPLDGGQVSRDLCEAAVPGRGLVTSLTISVAIAGFLAACGLLERAGQPILPFRIGLFAAIMFGLLAWQSYQELQRVKGERRWMDDHWDR
jgi:stage IV sporulation protein FB